MFPSHVKSAMCFETHTPCLGFQRAALLSGILRLKNPTYTDAVESSGYPWRPHLSGGCSACMEQSATRDSGLLLTFDISEGDPRHTLPSHASAEACFTSWPKAQPQGRD